MKLKKILEENLSDFEVSFKNEEDYKIQAKGVKLRNPLLQRVLQQPILNNLSNLLNSKKYRKRMKNLYSLYRKTEEEKEAEEKFQEEIRKEIINAASEMWEEKLSSDDIATSIFPTGVAYSEAPNYYIRSESYGKETKTSLLDHLVNSVAGTCGNKIYGVFIPKEPKRETVVLRRHLKEICPSLYEINVGRIMPHDRDFKRYPPGAFEYLFHLLDEPFKEMFGKGVIPSFHVELFATERGRGKVPYSHHIIPGLERIYFRLYYGENKYFDGKSKISFLMRSFIPEGWDIDASRRKRACKEVYRHLDNFLYRLFMDQALNLDSLLSLEEVKIKSSEKDAIWFMDEVISWM